MSARSRPPTEETKTEVFDSQSLRSQKPTKRGVEPSPKPAPKPARFPEGSEPARRGTKPTIGSKQKPAVEIATPTEVSPRKDRSEPMVMISMKTPAELAAEKQSREAKQHIVKLRALSELSSQNTPAMGYLAPPRDPKEARARKLRDFVIWGCAVVVVGCGVMLAVWFLARR